MKDLFWHAPSLLAWVEVSDKGKHASLLHLGINCKMWNVL